MIRRVRHVLLTAAASFGLVLPADAAAHWEPAKTYALLVGVLEWKHQDLAPFPKERRQDRVLEARLKANGVPAGNVVFLQDKAATLPAIRSALTDLAKRAGPGSTLFFYFAGHGIRDNGQYYLANHEMNPDKAAQTGFAVRELASILEKHWQGDRLLLTADCCHSGALAQVVEGAGRRGIKAACLTSATASNESTGEWTFTEALVSAFSGEGLSDMDRNGSISFADLDRHVSHRMKYEADQLTRAVRSGGFETDFKLRTVAAGQTKPAAPKGSTWQVGDYVECKSEGEWHRAKILAVGRNGYKVHYIGWGSEWDEEVTASRLRQVQLGKWRPGERIQVEYEGKWYPATIQKAEESFFYFVHYDEFDAEWDEWVTSKRMKPRR